MSSIREVRKRDNRVVPFDQGKIAFAIYRALRAVGEGDRSLSEELAAVVTHFLEERFADKIPAIEDIQDLVETVLMETDHPAVAKAYILYRQKRATLRESLEVRKAVSHGEGVSFDYSGDAYGAALGAEGASSVSPVFPEVEEALAGVSRWQKGRVTAALVREADLDPAVADEVAAAVERKVLQSGMQRLSTALIRELVDNELFERGFAAKLKRQAPIGLPKYNLEQIIFGMDSKEGLTFPKNPAEVRELIANRILQQYSLQQVFSPAVADAHRDGRLFLHRLTDPIRLARLRWSLPPPLAANSGSRVCERSVSAESYLDFPDFLRRMSRFGLFFSEEIRLANLPNLLLDPSLKGMAPRQAVRAVLDGLFRLGPRPTVSIEIALDSSSLVWFEEVLESSPTRPGSLTLVVRLHPEVFATSVKGAERLRRVLLALYTRGDRLEFLPLNLGSDDGHDRAGRRAARSGTAPGLDAVVAKVSVNLPRAAFRSGKDRRSSIEVELESAIDLAIRGLLERKQFTRRLAADRECPLWELLGGRQTGGGSLSLDSEAVFAVGLLGLNECVKFLTGTELHQSASGLSKGRDIVGAAARKLEREERGLGLRLDLEETQNVGPLRVLESVDRSLYAEIAEVDRSRVGPGAAGGSGSEGCYASGVRFHRGAPVDPLRRVEHVAMFLPYVRPAAGIVEELEELRESGGELLWSLLEEAAPLFSEEGASPLESCSSRESPFSCT